MVAALVLGTSGVIRGGSSPLSRTLYSSTELRASGVIRGAFETTSHVVPTLHVQLQSMINYATIN